MFKQLLFLPGFLMVSMVALSQEYTNPSTVIDPLPITTTPDYGRAGKGIFGVQFFGGGSYDHINTGIVAVSQKNTNDSMDVMLGPGGGLGIEIYGGKQLSKVFRMGIHGGFQYASGTPEIKGATIRYLKYYVMPMVNFSIPFNQKNGLNLGLGVFTSFGNSLKIEAPSGLNFKPVEITYKPNVGFASHLTYEYMMTEKAAFVVGLRFHWVDLEVSDISIGNSKGVLSANGEKRFNNLNGGGVAFLFGYNFFF